jgi:hypothetical protein
MYSGLNRCNFDEIFADPIVPFIRNERSIPRWPLSIAIAIQLLLYLMLIGLCFQPFDLVLLPLLLGVPMGFYSIHNSVCMCPSCILVVCEELLVWRHLTFVYRYHLRREAVRMSLCVVDSFP